MYGLNLAGNNGMNDPMDIPGGILLRSSQEYPGHVQLCLLAL
jgi:hypothetical protein